MGKMKRVFNYLFWFPAFVIIMVPVSIIGACKGIVAIWREVLEAGKRGKSEKPR